MQSGHGHHGGCEHCKGHGESGCELCKTHGEAGCEQCRHRWRHCECHRHKFSSDQTKKIHIEPTERNQQTSKNTNTAVQPESRQR